MVEEEGEVRSGGLVEAGGRFVAWVSVPVLGLALVSGEELCEGNKSRRSRCQDRDL